jgi:hypothetical protein
MTILSVIKGVCPVIGLDVPEAVFASTAREHIELCSVANEIATRIGSDTRDWTKLKTLATLSGDGVAAGFALPADYLRMIKKASLWSSYSPFAKLTHYPDVDQWLGLQVQNVRQLIGAWTIIGDQIQINPVVPSGHSVKFYYITKNIVKPTDGPAKAAFTLDTDSYVLDERVLRLGIIWQWRANKGLPYSEDLANYEDALAVAAGSDRGSNIITMGQRRARLGADVAYPGVIVP